MLALTNLGIKPNVLLALLVFFTIYCNTTDAIITSFIIGFAADISIGSVMGSQTISFGLFGTILAYLNRLIAIKNFPYQAFVIFITGCLTGSLAHFLALLKGLSPVANVFTVIMGTALFSAVIGPFLFLPTAWWMRIKTQRLKQY